MTDLRTCTWPLAQIDSALEALARLSGLKPQDADLPPIPDFSDGLGEELCHLEDYLTHVGHSLGLEVEQVYTTYADTEQMLDRARPGIFVIQVEDEQRVLAMLRTRGSRLTVLTPQLEAETIPKGATLTRILEPLEKPHLEEVNALLDATGVPEKRRARARAAMMKERLVNAYTMSCWLLRLPPGRSFTYQLKMEGVLSELGVLLGAHGLRYVLMLLGWWLIGRGALQGIVDPGWLWAWALLLFTEIPLRSLIIYAQGRISVGAGALLKKRLMLGILRQKAESLRHMGIGQMTSRVLEAETIETATLSGGFQALLAIVEVGVTAWVLSHGALPTWMLGMLTFWVLVSVGLGLHHYHSRKMWADERIEMTHDLIEKMVGHRTRLAQEPRESWHDGEDRALRDYMRTMRRIDHSRIAMHALLMRGWMVLGTLGLAIAFMDPGTSRAALAITLGGVLLGRDAFGGLAGGLTQVCVAAIAWTRIDTLFRAAAEEEHTPQRLALPKASEHGGAILQSRNIGFRYEGRSQATFEHCNLQIHDGDRLLLQGSSGAGKSTLGSILTGIRRPTNGLLLFRGLDLDSIGPRIWRKHIVSAPQFHENHVFTDTFLFNLLMGRNWPPRSGDMERAEEVCYDLGLGPLLERMPGGITQMVGETGWQLSHGERSRLFIARSILQGGDLLVLDESFAALIPDP